MLKDHPPCPKCGSRNVAQILYGLVQMNDELKQRLDKREITLGGCCVDTDSLPGMQRMPASLGKLGDDDRDSTYWTAKKERSNLMKPILHKPNQGIHSIG
jgi:hypothetical protein